MKATIRPLEGKYYGTLIDIITDTGDDTTIVVWIPSGDPSRREFESWGYTEQDWKNNIEVDDGWGGKVGIRSEYLCDNHYESTQSLAIAEKIVEALTK